MGYILTVLNLLLQSVVRMIFTLPIGVSSKVTCGIDANSVIIGKDVSVFCEKNSTSQCVGNDTRTWMGGHKLKSPDLLISQGFRSENASRFTEEVVSCQKVRLVIANFSENDLNQQISCTLGFQECRLNVSLSSANFEYHPKINDTKTDLNISSTALSLAIGIEHVYPVPNCSIIYGEKHLENLATVRINQSGMFYSAEVKLEYKSVKKKCPITANVICQFGGTRVTIISSNFNNCTSKELLSRELKDMRRPILAVLSVIASVTLSIQAKVISMKKVPQFEIDKEDIITPISLCLSSAALTPVSLGFISNPRTVSIRQGFKKAGENLMKRIKGWGCHVKSCMTNNINMTERILKHLNLLMKNISETDQKIIQIQTMQNPAVCYQCEKMYKHLFLNNFLYTFCCLYFSCLLL
ncbi:uncharacterized protein LOC143076224 isoform X2 [Mytilus galloprovincialis]|uniref:uncharacterized protein LOC143076224 isoform X2 n=1 Tax=Mytilus galloprovincialis TaxID=29158 RepID=UPI003F7C6DB3